MFLETITIGFMFGTIVVRWFTTSSLRSKRSLLAEMAEKNGAARHRLKVAVGDVNISEREIEKLERKIKGHERRIPQLQQELGKLGQAAEQQDELTREKLRLAQELQKKKGGPV